jgi:hypothetical protein
VPELANGEDSKRQSLELVRVTGVVPMFNSSAPFPIRGEPQTMVRHPLANGKIRATGEFLWRSATCSPQKKEISYGRLWRMRPSHGKVS